MGDFMFVRAAGELKAGMKIVFLSYNVWESQNGFEQAMERT